MMRKVPGRDVQGVVAPVAELADALDLGSSTLRCAGSTPASPTSPNRIGSEITHDRT